MLPRSERLNREEITAIIGRGRRYGGRDLGLSVLSTNQRDNKTRLAVVVPAKRVPSSVARHLIKRRIRRIISVFHKDLVDSQLIVVFCGLKGRDWPFTQLADRIRQLFIEAELIKS